jgi:DNA repair and recombination protein RAD52
MTATTKAKHTPAEVPAPSPEEAEREAHERAGQPEEEVKPEEFSRGIEQPARVSAFPAEVVAELRKPLDPNRIRRREGSGGRSLEYLAGHDVKRRANELFGFGMWGYVVQDLTEISAVEVSSSQNKPGWYVGYRALVEVWIMDDHGMPLRYSDVGYGDGVEYRGPQSRITACELASKEAVTDGLKRALTGLGDQFGLILYAKGDEKRKIETDRNRAEVRVEPQTPVPHSWAEGVEMFAGVLGDPKGERERAEVGAWMNEALFLRYGKETRSSLSVEELRDAGQRFVQTVYLIWERSDGNLEFRQGAEVREIVGQAFAERWEGIVPDGPVWRIGPDETKRPTWDEVKANEAGEVRSDAKPEAEADVKEEKKPE